MTLRKQIVLPAARKRFDTLCATANATAAIRQVTRLVEGRERHYIRQDKVISDGAQQTGKALIHAYANNYKELLEILPTELLSETLPSLRTNAEKLSRWYRQNVSSRTIRRHINELRHIGLITAYKHHGTRADIELWLSDTLLFGQAVVPLNKPVIQPQSEAGNSVNENGLGTKCPLKHTIETNSKKNNTIVKVESLGIEWKQNSNTAEAAQNHANKSTEHTNGNNLGGAAAVDKYVDKAVFGEKYREVSGFFRNQLDEFWELAHKSLWPERKFSSYERYRVLDTLTEHWFMPIIHSKGTEQDFWRILANLKSAVMLAKKYYESNTEYFPGVPYSTFEGTHSGYFDAQNPKGFNKALSLFVANKAKYETEQGNRILHLAQLHLRNHKAGKAPKRYQNWKYVDLISYYENKLLKYSQTAHQEFLAYVAAEKNNYSTQKWSESPEAFQGNFKLKQKYDDPSKKLQNPSQRSGYRAI